MRSSRVCPVATGRPRAQRIGGRAPARTRARLEAGTRQRPARRPRDAAPPSAGASARQASASALARRRRAARARTCSVSSGWPSSCSACSEQRRVGAARDEREHRLAGPRAGARARDGAADPLDQSARRAPSRHQPARVGGAELDVARVQALGLVLVARGGGRAHAPLDVGQPQLEAAAQRVLPAQLAGAPRQRERPRAPHAQQVRHARILRGRPLQRSRAPRARTAPAPPRPTRDRPPCGHGASAAATAACNSGRSNSSSNPSAPRTARRSRPLSSGVRARSTSPPQSGQRYGTDDTVRPPAASGYFL